MRYARILKLKDRLFFSSLDVSELFGITPQSAWVLCNRYVKEGIFIRLKKDVYTLEQNWRNWQEEDFFKVSNFLQVPSYISFMTALSFYEVTTQVQRAFFESASLKRSRRFEIKGVMFNFYKLKKEYYFDFSRKKDIFIASKEKAFMDAVYLYSFGKYKMDFDSIDFGKLDRIQLKKIIRRYPSKTKGIIKRLCRI
jgi:predicted transcriptional regulator of viral defense system